MVVSLALFKQALKIDYDDEDEYITTLIEQAKAAAEDYVGRDYDDDTAPRELRAAVQLMAGYFYEHRDGAAGEDYRNMREAFEMTLYPLSETDMIL